MYSVRLADRIGPDPKPRRIVGIGHLRWCCPVVGAALRWMSTAADEHLLK